MQLSITTLLILIATNFLIAGDLTGSVKYEGKVPKRPKLPMDSDPVCGAAHQDQVYSESFIVDTAGNLANVIVYLKSISAGEHSPEAAILDQKGCMYTPHILGVQAGQEVKILNSDPTMHNIHGLPKVNKEFNFGMPKTVKEKSVTFNKPEDMFIVKCDVHPWMRSYIQVFDHPFFSVTDPDGKYTISDIPDGEYEVVAWQEKFGSKRTITQTVTVEDSVTALDFLFIGPQKN